MAFLSGVHFLTGSHCELHPNTEGRGCYVSEDKGFVIWVGEEDHLRIMCMYTGTLLNDVFDRLEAALKVVNGIEGLEFAVSSDYGMVTSCPTNLGTGMRASVHIPIPNLTSDGTDAKAKAVCKPLGLSVRGTGGEHTPIGADGTCDISPSARFCITEAQIVTALYNGLKLLKEQEETAGTAADAASTATAPKAAVKEQSMPGMKLELCITLEPVQALSEKLIKLSEELASQSGKPGEVRSSLSLSHSLALSLSRSRYRLLSVSHLAPLSKRN
jgi:hypothetical protein